MPTQQKETFTARIETVLSNIASRLRLIRPRRNAVNLSEGDEHAIARLESEGGPVAPAPSAERLEGRPV